MAKRIASSPGQRPAATKGFSLVELLVVLMAIVLLMALLAPGLSSAVQSSQVVFCGSNQHAIGVALSAWLAAHKGRFPQIHNFGALLGNRGTTSHYGSDRIDEQARPLNRYLGYDDGPVRAAQCPGDRGDVLTYDRLFQSDSDSPAAYSPTDHAYTGYGSSYQEAFSKSRWRVKAVFGKPAARAWPGVPSLRVGQISRTDNKVLLGDWPFFGDRRLNSELTQWHAEDERRFNVLFADLHSEFFLFPDRQMEDPSNETRNPDPSFFWW